MGDLAETKEFFNPRQQRQSLRDQGSLAAALEAVQSEKMDAKGDGAKARRRGSSVRGGSSEGLPTQPTQKKPGDEPKRRASVVTSDAEHMTGKKGPGRGV